MLVSGCSTFPPTLEQNRTLVIEVVDAKLNTPMKGAKVRISKNYAWKFYWPLLSRAILAEYKTNEKGIVTAPISLKGDYFLEVFTTSNTEKGYASKLFDTRVSEENRITIEIYKKAY